MVLAAAGCASIGPATVQRDRVDYISAIAESWKEQTLLNVVRLRYGDAPSFADVSSVISGYTFQGGLSAGASISSDLTATIPSNLVTVNGNATYIDRPTITYTPLTGDKFARSLLRPLPPSEVFELIQAGYPADNVLLLTARAVNGIYNRSGIGARARQADPEFYPMLDALRRLQLSGAVSIRLVKRGADEVGMLILTAQRAQSVDQDLQFVRRTLGVTPDRNGEVSVSFGLLPRGPNEIALLTRSMAEILLEVCRRDRSACGPCRTGPHGRGDAPGRFRGPARSPLCSYPVVRVPAGRQLRCRPLPRHLVLDRRRRLHLEADLFIPADLLLSRRDRRHAAGAGADGTRQLSRQSAFTRHLPGYRNNGNDLPFPIAAARAG